jgi:hypothetical protein
MKHVYFFTNYVFATFLSNIFRLRFPIKCVKRIQERITFKIITMNLFFIPMYCGLNIVRAFVHDVFCQINFNASDVAR